MSKNQLIILNGLMLLIYVPFIFLGYGAHEDTFRVLGAGGHLFQELDYAPSRNPGCIVFEVITFILSSIGGSILSNFGTLIMGMVFINTLVSICLHFQIPNQSGLVAAVAIHPIFWINTTQTADFVWALGFTFLGFFLLIRKKEFYASLLFGLALGSRLASFISIGGILLFFLMTEHNRRKQIYVSMFLTTLFGLLVYLPSFAWANWTLDFLTPLIGGPELWTLKLRLGRFFYKNVYFWGLQTFVILFVMTGIMTKSLKNFVDHKYLSISILSLCIIFGNEVLYLKFPIRYEYLLPILPFSVILIGIGLSQYKRLLLFFVIVLASYNFISFNVARPNIQNQATGASYGFFIEKGVLLNDIFDRIELIHCDSLKCFQNVSIPRSRIGLIE